MQRSGRVWRVIRTGLCVLFLLAALVQIGYSIAWMAGNFNTVPDFGDTKEYLSLSETFSLDEYRPVLYPLLLKWARGIDAEHYYHYMFVLQTLASCLSLVFAVFVLDRVIRKKEKPGKADWILWVIGGLFLNAIPMITFMNFTVLTDSLANSFLVLQLSFGIWMIYGGKPTWGKGLGLALSMIGQSLLRADRFYSGMLLLVILFAAALLKNPGRRKLLSVGFLAVLAVHLGVVLPVRAATQVTGRNGRIETNLGFVLLDRVVWPHMAANYEYFPEEIRETISLDEAREFDSHNNKVMYQLAPLLQERVGKEKASEYEKTMAAIVWEHQSGDVLREIGECVLGGILTPLTHYEAIEGRYTKTNLGWNMRCLSMGTPELTGAYDRAGFYILLCELGLGILVKAGDLIFRNRRKRPFPQRFFAYAGLLVCLWFSLGDGAPFNDRYYLIIYIAYGLLALPLLLFPGTERQRDEGEPAGAAG